VHRPPSFKRTASPDMPRWDISADHLVEQTTKDNFQSVLKAIEVAVGAEDKAIAGLQRQVDEEKQRVQVQKNKVVALEAMCTALQLETNGNGRRAAEGAVESKPLARSEGFGNEVREPHPYKLHATLNLHENCVHGVAMKESVMASASWDGSVKIYDADKKQHVTTLNGWQGPDAGVMKGLYSVAFAKKSDHSHLLCCTSCDNMVYVWDYQNNQRKRTLQGHTGEVNGIDFHEMQQVICTASDDKTAILWDYGEGLKLRTLTEHTAEVYDCTFLGQKDQNQYLVATTCFDKFTRIFDMRDKKMVAKLEGHTDDVIGCDYNGRTNCLVTGSDDGLVNFWDVRKSLDTNNMNNALVHSINVAKETGQSASPEVKRVAFSPDGERLAVGVSSGQVVVYKYNGSVMAQHAFLSGHSDCVFDVAWGMLPNGKRVISSASHDKSSRIWQECY